MQIRSLLVSCMLVCLLATVLARGQNARLSMKSAMSAQEYAASGIGELRPEQQVVIDRFLNRWTDAALSVSRGGTYRNTGQKLSIEEKTDDGTILILEDDSIWLVESPDRVDSGIWLATDDVIVSRSKSGVAGYDYQILNLDDKESVRAKFFGTR